MKKGKDYPIWNYKTYKEWLRSVRKKWSKFRNRYKTTEIRTGCIYYPDEVYDWIQQFDKMDKLMKEYYKNA